MHVSTYPVRLRRAVCAANVMQVETELDQEVNQQQNRSNTQQQAEQSASASPTGLDHHLTKGDESPDGGWLMFIVLRSQLCLSVSLLSTFRVWTYLSQS